MPRTEEILMTGWEFGLMKCGPYSVAEAAKKLKVQGVPEEMPDIPEDLRFTSVRLPHDWAVDAPFDRNMVQGEDQGFRDRWGIGWYRRALRLEHKYPRYLYFMEFGGVYENCTVWVNEKCAGGHKYGYSTSYQAEGCLSVSGGGVPWDSREAGDLAGAASASEGAGLQRNPGSPPYLCGRVHRSV